MHVHGVNDSSHLFVACNMFTIFISISSKFKNQFPSMLVNVFHVNPACF